MTRSFTSDLVCFVARSQKVCGRVRQRQLSTGFEPDKNSSASQTLFLLTFVPFALCVVWDVWCLFADCSGLLLLWFRSMLVAKALIISVVAYFHFAIS